MSPQLPGIALVGEPHGARFSAGFGGIYADGNGIVVFPLPADRHAVVRKFLNVAARRHAPDSRAAAVHLIDTTGGEALAVGRIVRRSVDNVLLAVRHLDQKDVVALD